jgi:hypothetical protein
VFAILETYDSIADEDILSYRFDSAEAAQQAKMKKLKDVQDQIDIIEANIDQICRKLSGTGIVNNNLRRKRYY